MEIAIILFIFVAVPIALVNKIAPELERRAAELREKRQ